MQLRIDKEFLSYNKKKLIKAVAVILAAAVAFAVYLGKDEKERSENFSVSVHDEVSANAADVSAEGGLNDTEADSMIIVDVDGAVVTPGVVELDAEARVYDAIERAGGLTSEADTQLVNKAERLADGDKVFIPFKEKDNTVKNSGLAGVVTKKTGKSVIASKTAGETADNSTGLININTADSSKLQQLKGVGPSTAEKIISYRQQQGDFKKIEDLMNVSGIGKKTFEALKDKITV